MENFASVPERPYTRVDGTPGRTKHDFAVLRSFPTPAEEAPWRDFLQRMKLPEHYGAPEFFLEPWWEGKNPFAVLAFGNDKVEGVATGVHDGDRMDCGLSTRPQVWVDGAHEKLVCAVLAQGLLAEAGSAKLITAYSRTPLPSLREHGFRVRQMEGSVVLDLTKGPEALMKQFHPTRRRNIRFAMKQGLEVSPALDGKDFEECYELLCQWRRTQRKQIVGEQLPFSTLLKAWSLSRSRRTFLVRLNGKVIASDTVRFYPGGLLEAAANCSLDEYLHLKPNDLVMWRIIEWACNEGFTRFSLCGAHPFLRYFGGTVEPAFRYRLDRTLLRKHDSREAIFDMGRAAVHKMPGPVRKMARQLLDRG